MNDSGRRAVMGVVAVWLIGSGAAGARDLSFDERLHAQEAIERVYYAHQIGADLPFERAVTGEVLEKKVRTYLRESLALANFWTTPVTAEMLRAEIERIARDTRFPDRLGEIYAALGNDPYLVQECFARPVLVDRLVRDDFASDARWQSSARAEAEALRARIESGEMSIETADPRRSVVEIVRAPAASVLPRRAEVGVDAKTGARVAIDRSTPDASLGETKDPTRPVPLTLDPSEFADWRARLPARAGEIGEIIDDRDAFRIRAPLALTDERLRVATWTVPKVAWDAWWSEVEDGFDPASVHAVALGGFSLPAPGMSTPDTSGVDDTWDAVSLHDTPTPRSGHTMVWTGTLAIVWGGTDPNRLGSGSRYDPLTDTWLATSVVGAPDCRRLHSAVWTGSEMIVWGGTFCAGGMAQSGARYNPTNDTWVPTSLAVAPQARSSHTGVWTGTRMIVWGGTASDGGPVDTGGVYDPSTDAWSSTSGTGAPAARSGHTAVWTGARMIVWGGGGGGAPLGTGGVYDPSANTWTATSLTGAPTARTNHTAIWTGGEMIVWGGSGGPSGPYLQTGARYNPAQDKWTATKTQGAPVGREKHTAVWTGSRMLVWGGDDPSYLGDGASYDPAGNSWSSISGLNAPASRSAHAAVWSGSRMIVWGGLGPSSLSSGGRYDPTADSWTPTRDIEAPSPRYDHAAIWSGSQMIVWGGWNGAALNTGGRYDPLVDQWFATSTVNAPSARRRHTMIWTGSRAVVWGGDDGSSYLGTGGRYDPTSDSWASTSTTGAPVGRAQHTAVWTGSQMIVWGGANTSGVENTGGRYDPGADSWSATSTSGAPSARSRHSAVWTGSRMIVWGGAGAASTLDTGGRYDPAADSWLPVSNSGPPTPREDLSAIWTGTRMIVWGGTLNGYLLTNSGGRYDPASDSWSPTSMIAAPAARSLHVAVWTGLRMIVWGGVTPGPAVSTGSGGRYDPVTDLWFSTSNLLAPSARSRSTAVWTGDRLLIWGGADPSGAALSSGGVYNVRIVDSDGDGAEDTFDCAPGDPTVFRVPPDMLGDELADDRITYQWQSMGPSAGSAISYDVERGRIGQWPVGTGPAEACMASSIAGTSVQDSTTPPMLDGGFYYLVRGRNTCGVGTYGPNRTTAVCP